MAHGAVAVSMRGFVLASALGLLAALAWAGQVSGHRPSGAGRAPGSTVSGQAPDPAESARELWVTSQGTDTVYVLSFPQGEIVDQLALPAGAGPHITTFYGGRYAYVSGMGNGTLYVVDADQRRVVQALKLAPGGAHQARVSPDGAAMLVSVVPSRTLFKVAVDEAGEAWNVVGSVSLEPLDRTPICAVFRADGQRAYVSLLPDGLAVIDVPSMTVLGTLPTDGFVACGMIVTPDATRGFGTSPQSDEVVVVDLSAERARAVRTLLLDPLRTVPSQHW